jgi:hypothetical protein
VALDSVLETVVNPGQTVYVRVSKFGGSAANSFFLNAFFTTPANDACANAIAIGDGNYAFCTNGATTDPATGGPTESFCSGFGDNNIGSDVWYSYVAPCDGLTSVVLCGSSFDTKLGAYAGTCPSAPNAPVRSPASSRPPGLPTPPADLASSTWPSWGGACRGPEPCAGG